MARLMEQRVTIRLGPRDAEALDRLRGPVAPSTFLRLLLRQAAAEAEGVEPPGRDDALAALTALGESDVEVAHVVRKIETADKLARWRLLAGD